MAHGSISNVLEEHVVGVIVHCVCRWVGEVLCWCMVRDYCLRCGQCIVCGALLLVALSPLAKFSCCFVDSISEQSYCGEVLDGGNVCVHQHEGMNVGEVVSIQSEDPIHGSLENRAAAVMFYGVLGVMATLEKARVMACVALLESPCSVPFIPYCAKDSRPDPRCRGML